MRPGSMAERSDGGGGVADGRGVADGGGGVDGGGEVGAGDGGGEGGFTVVETVLAASMLLLVMTTFLGLLDSQTKAERRLRHAVDNQEDVRFALLAVARDVRAADPLLPLASVADYSNKIEMQLKNTDGTSRGYVRWTFDAVTTTLTRQTLSAPGGAATGTTYSVTRVRNADVGVPLFRYYNSENTELTSAVATSGDFANCTIRIHITLWADANPGPAPFSSESDAELRNRLPGGIGC